MRQLFKCIVAAVCALPLATMADFEKTNPVTGETESYSWKFVGTDTWDDTSYWQDSSSANPSGVPAKSGGNVWDPVLFDGDTVNIDSNMSVEGWNLRMGLYNGASVKMNTVVKYQGDTTMWMTVDETSQLTFGGFSGGNITANQAIKLSVAKANGIAWNADLSSGNANNTFEYYLKGAGSVSYQAVSAANHMIKMADIVLTGVSQVANKTLVSFTSSSKTFSADATIKRLNSSGTDLNDDAHLAAVNATGTTTLTTSDAVGTCELVQTSTGIELFWVDGDPAALTPTVYKPSININFTQGTGLSTAADVGVGDYAVPGTSWDNIVGSNGSLTTVNGVDSTGSASIIVGAKLTISGTRGYWGNGGVPAASDLRNGYIDDNDGNPSPQFVVEGIPYYSYKTILYFSSDSDATKFGYVTVNGVSYKGDLENTTTVASEGGSDIWGSASLSAFTEGGNYLVIPTQINADGTLTVVSHRLTGSRAGLAAVQIVEVKPEAGADDLVIEVSGDTEYTVADAKELTGTVYITGSGTLTLTGEAKISAATINVGPSVTLIVNSDRLDGTTFTGAGTVVYDGSQPDTTKGFDASAWTGTVWVKNIGSAPAGETSNTAVTLGTDTTDASSNELNSWGNANSYVKFTNVRGHMAAATCAWTLVLEDGADTYAWYNNNGWTGRDITIAALEGDGTFYDQANNGCRQILTFTDASNFAGSFNISGKRIGLGGNNTAENNQTYRGTIEVVSGTTVTVASGKTWTTGMGFRVYGAINANGSLAADNSATACVRGSGTVTFGGVPSPTGDAWWKNSEWTGTVEIKGVTALNGDYVFNNYGNAASTLKLTNCSGWLKPNYTCVPALEIGGTFTWNDGSSGLNNTFKVATLKGSGTISIPSGGAATAVWQIIDDWAGFTGAVVGNNSSAARVLVFGATLPTTVTAGEIYISEGATLNLDNSSSAWWGVGMGFVVDGTVKASARNKWGGGTYMTLGDAGVLEFVSSANTNDENTDMSGITGTGTLKFSSSAGWRAFPKTDANMPATTLTIQSELADSLILPTKTNGVTVVGNLAGSKNIRSDWSNNGEDGRILTVTQSKNTEWQGKFVSNRITKFNVVAPAEGTPGTLTLSGAQDTSIPMQIDGSVNLAGTWVGATTVAGTLGGTGTITGNLTFSDGATFKAAATALTVSGTVALPTGEGESLTIDATALEDDEVTILSSSSITTETDVSKVTVNGPYAVEPDDGVLKLVSTRVEVTVPTIPNTTVTVTVGGETIGTEPGAYKVAPDSVVTVTYAAAPGYEISGTTAYTIDTSKSETTFNPAETTHVAQYVAYVVFQQEQEHDSGYDDVTNYYTTVAAAIDAAKSLNKTIVLVAQPDAADTYAINVGETINVKKGEFTFNGIIFPEGSQYVNTTTEIAGVTQYKCAVYTATVQYPGQEPESVTGQLMQILGGLYSSYAPSLAGTVVTVLDGSDATIGDAMPEVFTYNSEAHTYTLKTMVASINTGAVDIYYPTISNAFEAVVSGQTIKVLCDNTSNVRSVRVKEGATVTLDLNGCTVTGPSEDNPMFWLEDNSNFVVTDTTEDRAGKLVSEASKVVWSNNRCTFTLTAGTIESTADLPIYIYFGGVNGSRIVNINGGKLVSSTSSSSNGDFCIMNANGIVNMTAGEIVSSCGGIRGSESSISGGTITVNRGVFYNTENQRVTGGTFNKDVSEYVPSGYEVVNNGDGTYTVRPDMGWIYSAPGAWDYTGTWEGATLGDDKVTIETNATYTASAPSANDLVTLNMTLCFDDANDDDIDLSDVKGAVRLGKDGDNYVFQLATTGTVNEVASSVWANASCDTDALAGTDYKFLFVLNLSTKTYTASVIVGTTTNALSVAGSTTIAFANYNKGAAAPVQELAFIGSGSVSSLTGSYEDPPAPPEFVENEEVALSGGSKTLTAREAAWLNACGDKATVGGKIGNLSAAAFNRAYLLNLDVCDDNYSDVEKPLSVTAISVGDTTVTVTVTVTRNGAFANEGINGTLKLKGAATLDSSFEVISTAEFEDEDFSESDTTSTTFDKGEDPAKFYKAVIE